MNIACARRRIENKVIQLTPVCISNQLLQGRTSHSAAPQSSRSRTYEETDTQELHAVFLDRFDEVSAVLVNRIRTLLLHTEHLRHGRTEDIRIEQAHLVAQLSQGNGEIGRNGALAYSTLTRAHSDDVLHLWQHLSHLRTRSRLELSNDFHLYIFRNMIMDGSLSRLYRTLEERIRITRKEKNHLHLHTIDARRICQHLALYEVLLGAWINHRSKRLFNQFWI